MIGGILLSDKGVHIAIIEGGGRRSTISKLIAELCNTEDVKLEEPTVNADLNKAKFDTIPPVIDVRRDYNV